MFLLYIMYVDIYLVHQKHHLSRSFLQKKAYKTTEILEIRLADISSLLVKDFVRATDQAARAVTIYTLIGNVRRSTVKIREHMWAVTTVTIFAPNKINVKR